MKAEHRTEEDNELDYSVARFRSSTHATDGADCVSKATGVLFVSNNTVGPLN